MEQLPPRKQCAAMSPPSDKRQSVQIHKVVTFFQDLTKPSTAQHLWTRFRLDPWEYEELQRQLGSVEHKKRLHYFADAHLLCVQVRSTTHEIFLQGVIFDIDHQLEVIRGGVDKAAVFAKAVCSFGSATLFYRAHSKSTNDPDSSFGHEECEYPGVIVEISHGGKNKDMKRLAHAYLVSSRTGVQVVVGLDIERGMNGSRKATLSVWRSEIAKTPDGLKLKVVEEVSNEAFRDDEGNPTSHPGLRLRLREFEFPEFADHQVPQNEDRELIISTQQLCRRLDKAETREQREQQWKSQVEVRLSE